jgi:hypothetical protein
VVWAGHFEKFIEMVLRLLCLVLEITFDGRDILLAKIVSFLITVAIADHNGDVSGAPLLPLLAVVGVLPSALDGGLGWCDSAAAGVLFHVA